MRTCYLQTLTRILRVFILLSPFSFYPHFGLTTRCISTGTRKGCSMTNCDSFGRIRMGESKPRRYVVTISSENYPELQYLCALSSSAEKSYPSLSATSSTTISSASAGGSSSSQAPQFFLFFTRSLSVSNVIHAHKSPLASLVSIQPEPSSSPLRNGP